MSKSSIKTKTVLTMTDMTESSELLALKRQRDGYKVTVKISFYFPLWPVRHFENSQRRACALRRVSGSRTPGNEKKQMFVALGKEFDMRPEG